MIEILLNELSNIKRKWKMRIMHFLDIVRHENINSLKTL